ncbi:MAG: hypothetical protein COX62_07635 [Deltaproteobacteria bacterium CG_4_10_14_0_2_um_filter_43_8]|nr:MAG: hypothetical protein COV43_03055 [Deltaproteobacteria bacterium CG11_big_fil_rev_8_21_14_0_20_42_23]PJA18988.1 MAG: hypothetical protein COX62_07635 [Deltaproteobacteria bacterium CG_4_10_14_0_2_um_filter_43_8]PJC63756.1 MAG: hypothetical protein CO021_07670 [Deltaproteobacteria bacterium CG_4_9_14_0_2_um_filter_42_21]
MKSAHNTGSGLAPNIACMLCYLNFPLTCVFPILSGIFLFIEREDKDIRFHAWQSTLLSSGFLVLLIVLKILAAIMGAIASVLGVLVGFFIPFVLLAALGVWVVCLLKAYQGQRWRLPIIGDIAAKQVGLD